MVSSRVDEISEAMQTAQARVESVGGSLERETSQRQCWSREAQQANDHVSQDTVKVMAFHGIVFSHNGLSDPAILAKVGGRDAGIEKE